MLSLHGCVHLTRCPPEPSTDAVQWGEGAVLTVIFSSPQDFLQGDCTKARQKLNWKPRVTFDVSGEFVPTRGSRSPGATQGGGFAMVSDHPALLFLGWQQPLSGMSDCSPWERSVCSWREAKEGTNRGVHRQALGEPHLPIPRWAGGSSRCRVIPDTWALTHLPSSSQELVREMVDADVELMRSNPNA